MNTSIGIPYKVKTVVNKWNSVSQTGTDREPDAVVDLDEVWYEAAGSVVTDPVRIEQLELQIKHLVE